MAQPPARAECPRRQMRRLALLVLAFSGCKCGAEKVVYAGPHAQVASTLEFGAVRLATQVTKPVVITNDGRQELTVLPALDAASDPAFEVSFKPEETLTVAAGDTLE